MKSILKFLSVWLAALTILVTVAWVTVSFTTRSWFEKDVALRAELAVSGARRALLAELERKNIKGLRELLVDISQDERILAAALCSTNLRRQIAATEKFQEEFS